MNTERIIELIEPAMTEGLIGCAYGSPFNLYSFASVYYRDTHTWTPDTFLNRFIEHISEEKEIQHLKSCALIVDTVIDPLSVGDIVEWLLARTLKEGAAAAIERVSAVMKGQLPYLEILAICGITPFEETRLTDDIVWIPFDQLPASTTKDYLAGIAMFDLRMPDRSPYPEPASALVRSGSFFGRIVPLADAVGTDVEEASSARGKRLDHLLDIAGCLTLFGAASIPVMYWVQPDDWNAIPGMKLITAQHYLSSDLIPSHYVSVGGGDYADLIARYITLDQPLKDRLRIPIARLNSALTRHSLADQAIELGIALESLLTFDRDSNSPIAFLLKLRGALLLGVTIKERKDYMKTLGDLYALRSSAVHSGSVKKWKNPEEITRKASGLCEKVIRLVIQRGHFPDWEELTLTGAEDWHSRASK